MKYLAILIALFLVQFHLPWSVNNVSAQSDLTDVLKKQGGLTKELKDLGSGTQSEDPDNREIEEHPQPQTDMGNTKDILLRAFEDEKRVLRKRYSKVESVVSRLRSEVKNITDVLANTEQESADFERHVTSEMKKMKETVEKNENMSLRLEQQVTDLRHENDNLMKKYTRCSSMQDQINSNSKSLSNLNEQFGKLDLTVNDVSKSLQKIADEFGDHKRSFNASIRTAVENREKCQSGDEVGPHTFRPRPDYPATVTVRFSPPFEKRPVVVYGLKTLDSDYTTNVRLHAEIVELTNKYFNLRIDEWADTIMYGAKFSWMACPT